MNHMDRLVSFRGRDLNSHHPTHARYTKMLTLFEPMRARLSGDGLGMGELVALLIVQAY